MQYDFNLEPGGGQTIDVRGRFFKYRSGNGLIRVRTSLGGFVDLLPGQGVENVNFTSLTVSDRSGAVNAGVILAGEFDFRDDRIAGSVEVIDGGRNRTMANQAFVAATYRGGIAGNSALIQLFNPVDSGRRVVVGWQAKSSAGGGNVGICVEAAPLSTFDKYAQSKLSGGAPSKAQLRTESRVGNFIGASLASDTMGDRRWIEPVVLMPGYGLTTWSGTLGQDVLGAFEFFEDLI